MYNCFFAMSKMHKQLLWCICIQVCKLSALALACQKWIIPKYLLKTISNLSWLTDEICIWKGKIRVNVCLFRFISYLLPTLYIKFWKLYWIIKTYLTPLFQIYERFFLRMVWNFWHLWIESIKLYLLNLFCIYSGNFNHLWKNYERFATTMTKIKNIHISVRDQQIHKHE